MNVLVMVDIQKDFYSGKLAVFDTPEERTTFANNIWKLLDTETYDLIVATQDWHPWNHCSFERNGGVWPTHCVQGSDGAELCSFIVEYPHVIIRKGMDKDTEEYSGVKCPLTEIIGIPNAQITIIGLATEYCVKETALAATNYYRPSTGATVSVRLDCCGGINAELTDKAVEEMTNAGINVLQGKGKGK